MSIPLPNSVERILLDEATIQQRVQQMADIISTDYAGLRNEEFLLVGVLKGSFMFMADLRVSMATENLLFSLCLLYLSLLLCYARKITSVSCCILF